MSLAWGVRRAPWALLVIPLAVLAWTVWGVAHNYTAVPYDDQWENIWWWRRILEHGKITDGYLFSQHNEHRIFLPRLVFMADLKWFRGTNVLSMAAIAGIQLAAAALFVKASSPRTLRLPGVLALALALGLTFSAVQWGNFFWGFQVSFLGVYAAGAWALYLFTLATEDAARPRWGVLAGAVVVLAAATVTMASGVFAGVIMVLVGLVARRGLRATVAAGVATAVLLGLYMYGYKSVPHPAPPAQNLAIHYLGYVLAYLGNVWSLGRPNWGAAAGAVGVLSTLVMTWMALTGRARDVGRVSMLGLALFIGISAAVTAWSRLGYGFEHALSSRYTTPTCYFWAAQALFWGLTAQGSGKILWKLAAAVPLVTGLAILVPMQKYGLTPLYGVRERILLGSSALVGGIDDETALKRLYPEAARVREFMPFLRSRGLSVFADDPGFRAGSQVPKERIVQPTPCRGGFDIAAPDRDGGATWQVLGWAFDMEQKRTLDRVLIADPDGRVAGVAFGGLRRDDVHKVLKDMPWFTGWTGVVQPQPGKALTAYGVRTGGTLCDLGTLRPSPAP